MNIKTHLAVGLALAMAMPVAASAPEDWQQEVQIQVFDSGAEVLQQTVIVGNTVRASANTVVDSGASYAIDLTPIEDEMSFRATIEVSSGSVGELSASREVQLDAGHPVRLEFGNTEPGVRPIRIEMRLAS